MEFESEFGFSNETMEFMNESCSSAGWQAENGLFRMADSSQLKELLNAHKDLRSFWNGSPCPVQTGTQFVSENKPIYVELTFTKHEKLVKRINPLRRLLYRKICEEFIS